jgi:hypothetical protein
MVDKDVHITFFLLMIFIATGGVFNLMGFSMASGSPGDREAIENPIKYNFFL